MAIITGKINLIIADWEMQCCGIPFEKGDIVNWKVSEILKKDEYYEEVDAKAEYYYEGHASPKKLYQVKGIVTKIQKVYAKFELKDPLKRFYIPVDFKFYDFDGTATGWEEDIGEYRFSSYLVELEEEL